MRVPAEPGPGTISTPNTNRHLPEGVPDTNSRDTEAGARMQGMPTGSILVDVPIPVEQWYAGASTVPFWGTYEVQGVMHEHLLGPGTVPLSLPQYMPSVAATQDLVVFDQVDGRWTTGAPVPGARPGNAQLGWVLLQPGVFPGTFATPGARPGNVAPTLGVTPGATPGTPPIVERYVLESGASGVLRRQLVLDC